MKVSVKLLKGLKLFLSSLIGFVILIILIGVGYSLYLFINVDDLGNPDISNIVKSGNILRTGSPRKEDNLVKYNYQGYFVEAKKGENNYSIKIKATENYFYPDVEKYFVDTNELEFSFPVERIKAQTEAELNEDSIKKGDLVLIQWEYSPTKNILSFKDYSLCLLKEQLNKLRSEENPNCYISQNLTNWSITDLKINSEKLLKWFNGLNEEEVVNNLAEVYKSGDFFAIDERYYDDGKVTLGKRLIPFGDSSQIYSGILGYSSILEKTEIDVSELLNEKLLVDNVDSDEPGLVSCRLGYESLISLEQCGSCQKVRENIFKNCEDNLGKTLKSFEEKYPALIKRETSEFNSTRSSFGDGYNLDYSILNLPSEFIYYSKIVSKLGITEPRLNIEVLNKYSQDYYRNSLEIYESAINADMVLPTCYLLNNSVEMYKNTNDKVYLDNANYIYSTYPYQLYCDGNESNDSTFCSKKIFHKLSCVEAMYNYATIVDDNVEITKNAKTMLAQIMYRYYSGSPRAYKINSYTSGGEYFTHLVNHLVEVDTKEENVRTSTSTLLDSGYAIYILNKY